MSELHGNVNLEVCEECEQEYWRDFAAERIRQGRDHFTGRFCTQPRCKGRLLESTVDFDQKLQQIPLQTAFAHAQRADLCIVMGSSCTVAPASEVPQIVKKKGGKLVVINLQKTPMFDLADLNIFGRTDEVMEGVMTSLHLEIPVWRKRRRIEIQNFVVEGEWTFAVRGLRQHDGEEDVSFSSIREIRVDVGGGVVFCREEPFRIVRAVEFLHQASQLELTLFWYGHHHESPFKIPLSVREDYRTVLMLTYDLEDRSWTWRAGNSEGGED